MRKGLPKTIALVLIVLLGLLYLIARTDIWHAARRAAPQESRP
jgi:hypothetical protein